VSTEGQKSRRYGPSAKRKEVALLPYWNSDLALEIAPWFPLGVDYQPISINRLYSPQLKQIAARCLELDSEFFFVFADQGLLMRFARFAFTARKLPMGTDISAGLP